MSNSRANPNPLAIEPGDRVVFNSGYPSSRTGKRIPVDVRGIVEEIEFDNTWPMGLAYIAIELESIPEECRWEGMSKLAAVRLEKVRHDMWCAA